MVFDNATRFKIVEFVRLTRPDMVFTRFPQDYMPGHQITTDLVWDACFNAPIPNYFINQADPAEHTDKIPCLFYRNGIEGLDRLGSKVDLEFYVDISSVIEVREEILKKHESQRSWLKVQHGIDQYLLTIQRWDAEGEREANVKFAGGFIQHKGHSFPRENILKGLLPVIFR
ncbi:MAG: PIG-L deacetylase family protein [Thermoproteota archaeon]